MCEHLKKYSAPWCWCVNTCASAERNNRVIYESLYLKAPKGTLQRFELQFVEDVEQLQIKH